jgi:hypothetical protein
MQLGGVMEGLHSVDVGVIISPAITEAIEGMAKQAEVEYTVFGKDPNEDVPNDSQISLAMRSLAKEKVEDFNVEDVVPKDTEIETQEPKGLMARRNSNGI